MSIERDSSLHLHSSGVQCPVLLEGTPLCVTIRFSHFVTRFLLYHLLWRKCCLGDISRLYTDSRADFIVYLTKRLKATNAISYYQQFL